MAKLIQIDIRLPDGKTDTVYLSAASVILVRAAEMDNTAAVQLADNREMLVAGDFAEIAERFNKGLEPYMPAREQPPRGR